MPSPSFTGRTWKAPTSSQMSEGTSGTCIMMNVLAEGTKRQKKKSLAPLSYTHCTFTLPRDASRSNRIRRSGGRHRGDARANADADRQPQTGTKSRKERAKRCVCVCVCVFLAKEKSDAREFFFRPAPCQKKGKKKNRRQRLTRCDVMIGLKMLVISKNAGRNC